MNPLDQPEEDISLILKAMEIFTKILSFFEITLGWKMVPAFLATIAVIIFLIIAIILITTGIAKAIEIIVERIIKGR